MSDGDVALILERLDQLTQEVRALKGEAQAGAVAVVDGRVIPDHPMTPEEFGVIVGKSPQTVRRWIDSGRLKAKTDVRPYLIIPVNARKFLNPKEDRE